MSFDAQFFLTFGVLSTAAVVGIRNVQCLDRGGRYILLLVAATLVTEATAYFFAKKYNHNIAIYNVFSIIEFLLVSFYFNASVALLRRYDAGVWIGIIGVFAGIASLIGGDTLLKTNSGFLIVQGIGTIVLSLFSLQQLFSKAGYQDLRLNPHFWTSLAFLFFWCTTLLFWPIYDQLVSARIPALNLVPYWISVVTNICFALILLYYPQMHSGYGR